MKGFAAKYGRNITSQWGEDGIIAEILKRIGVEHHSCAEAGAYDGKQLSNTYTLWHDRGFHGHLFEADLGRFAELFAEASHPNTTLYKTRVANFDDYLTEPVDVLSLDIDGDEYYVLERMQVKHRVLIVEHNPTIPPHMHIIGREGQPEGSSALALKELAHDKGYALVAATKSNLVFVLDEYAYLFDDLPRHLSAIFDYSCLNYVVTDYQGRYRIEGILPYGMEKLDKGILPL
jgi:hypothetical protein